MTTSADTYTLFKDLTKAGMDEDVAKVLVKHEAARKDDIIERVKEIIVAAELRITIRLILAMITVVGIATGILLWAEGAFSASP